MAKSAPSYTVLLADDHPIFLEGLVTIIENDAQFSIISRCSDGEQAKRDLADKKPDLAVLDISMPDCDGLELLQFINEQHLTTRVVILTMHDDPAYFHTAFQGGALGYVLKENSKKELLACMRNVASGKHFVSGQFSGELIHSQAAVKDETGISLLTPAEKNIMRLIAENKTSRQIADELFISIRTVENHRQHICVKLDLHGPHQLLHFALQNKKHL